MAVEKMPPESRGLKLVFLISLLKEMGETSFPFPPPLLRTQSSSTDTQVASPPCLTPPYPAVVRRWDGSAGQDGPWRACTSPSGRPSILPGDLEPDEPQAQLPEEEQDDMGRRLIPHAFQLQIVCQLQGCSRLPSPSSLGAAHSQSGRPGVDEPSGISTTSRTPIPFALLLPVPVDEPSSPFTMGCARAQHHHRSRVKSCRRNAQDGPCDKTALIPEQLRPSRSPSRPA